MERFPISEITFKNMPTPNKLDTMFDLMVVNYENEQTLAKDLAALNQKVERRKKFDTGVAASMGLIGGAVVWLGKLLFWK